MKTAVDKMRRGKARDVNGQRSAVPRAVVRTDNYAISQKLRERIEQGPGWTKTIGGLRKLPMVASSLCVAG